MKLLFYVFCNQDTGFGHWYRSLTLARTAIERGHTVTIATDGRAPAGIFQITTKYNDPGSYKRAVEASKPDWVFVDLPGVPPAWVRAETPGKICTLNGIGYNQNDGADLRIIQGMAEVELPGPQDRVPVLKGIEYVILRPELIKYKHVRRGGETTLWGGGMDVMGLHRRFLAACPDRFAVHLISEMIEPPAMTGPAQVCIQVTGESLLAWVAGGRALVGAMGMICWEAAYLGLPQWIFSSSDLHLRFALAMDDAGLIKAYPAVGLPESNDEFRAFLSEPFEPGGEPPTLDGAINVLKAIEEA